MTQSRSQPVRCRRLSARIRALVAITLASCSSAALQAAESASAPAEPLAVRITDKGCETNAITAPAGKTTFRIRNDSKRTVEWEILKGVDVVAERENILPGFVQNLTATLDAGDYQITCGLLSNPKGSLKVAAGAAAPAGPPSPMDLVGPIAEYKVYATQEIDALVTATRSFVEAIKGGKIEAARQLYAPAHLHYERIEPIAELFNDLDARMDSREDDFEKKAADPSFIGFHRIEKGLFADHSLEGLAPIADRLLADAQDLQGRLATLTITPKSMVGGAADLIEEVASKKISGEEDRYSRTDLWDFKANVDGARRIVDLLRPLVTPRDPALEARIADNFGKVDAILGKYQGPDGGYLPYDTLSSEDRNRLKGPVTVLAEDLSTLRGTLGID